MAGNWNSGRRPQATRLRVLRGNPGKRRINPAEAAPPVVQDPAFDVPPGELAGDERAAAEWRRVAPLLRACQLATEAERPLLVSLCQQWSRYLEATADVTTRGMLVDDADGLPMANPYLRIADRALQHCHRLWMELGLTPAGRAKIAALPSGETDDRSKWAGLVSGVTQGRRR